MLWIPLVNHIYIGSSNSKKDKYVQFEIIMKKQVHINSVYCISARIFWLYVSLYLIEKWYAECNVTCLEILNNLVHVCDITVEYVNSFHTILKWILMDREVWLKCKNVKNVFLLLQDHTQTRIGAWQCSAGSRKL